MPCSETLIRETHAILPLLWNFLQECDGFVQRATACKRVEEHISPAMQGRKLYCLVDPHTRKETHAGRMFAVKESPCTVPVSPKGRCSRKRQNLQPATRQGASRRSRGKPEEIKEVSRGALGTQGCCPAASRRDPSLALEFSSRVRGLRAAHHSKQRSLPQSLLGGVILRYQIPQACQDALVPPA